MEGDPQGEGRMVTPGGPIHGWMGPEKSGPWEDVFRGRRVSPSRVQDPQRVGVTARSMASAMTRIWVMSSWN